MTGRLLDRYTRAEVENLIEEADDHQASLIAHLLDIELVEDGGWRAWLAGWFPQYVPDEFAPFHEQVWDWVWAIEPDVRPRPLVEVVFRGGAKSTTAELACVAFAAREVRRYGLYICETQDQADDHVSNIGSLLEADVVSEWWPDLGSRRLGKYGTTRAWRVNRLSTATGFTIDAVGLDTAARGVKLEEHRPDFMIIDDIDNETDTGAKVARKILTLTRGLLPAGSTDLAVLAIQNLVHEDSVFAQLVDGRADFLADRQLIGPVPAVEDLEWRATAEGGVMITAGTATWAGMPIARCQEAIDTYGFSAWLSEAQHDTEPPAGGMFDHLDFAGMRRPADDVPWTQLERTVVWVDPAVTATDQSDAHGVQVDAIDEAGVIWRLRSWEQRATPVESLTKAIRWAIEFGAEHVGVETDQGGDTWRSVYLEAARAVLVEMGETGEAALDDDGRLTVDGREVGIPPFTYDKAGAGHGPKQHRASLMLSDYEHGGRIWHVEGTHLVLERALRRFPKVKPFDLVDVCYWGWQDLRGRPVRTLKTAGHRLATARVATGLG